MDDNPHQNLKLNFIRIVLCNSQNSYSSQRRKMEMKNELLMTKKDFDFYNDQKGPRLGKCLKTDERLTKKDLLFKRRSRMTTPQTDSPSCSYSATT